ncbi:lipoamide acyltransferase component of branched-chain alpha-keto acid dehydrogenase complex, mitochondrial [Venturia canescens]|uniref:lipoamide acyltransferase component of branched-chain alpha-keto acid dehydrogenase complex, mitochondrial n=1 Tax=Venturia canescens TaxID=32260 RepID=UPI001C9D0C3E|nr:lipoamide acyltransferase component of branched-chain alpha-keto acid dehydrogenase complex, mitochondrial [Venturia canescens]
MALRVSAFVRLGKVACAGSGRFLSLSSAKYGTVVPFKLSDIGEGIREVTIKEWFVSPGDKVAQFDQICEVQSDKASVTITSRYDGHVRTLHYKIDETALVGDSLVDIELLDDIPGVTTDDQIRAEAGENLAASAPPNVHLAHVNHDDTNVESIKKFLTTPAVRRIAWENNIDLGEVTATGKNGRVLKEDLLGYLEKKSPGKSSTATGFRANFVTSPDQSASGIVSLKGYEKSMWKSMTQSLNIPHFVYSDECDVTKLVLYRSEVKDHMKEQGISLSFMPFFIKAASRALHEFPRLNSWLDESSQTLKLLKEHNISIAMDTPDGLVVPNIKNVENLSISEIAKELNRLQELGKKCSIPLGDICGGTFSLSNIGVVGGTYTKPVILQPQVVIGAIGKVQKLPRFDKLQNVIAADILTVSWAADHRVVDGVTMAKFSNRWRHFVENPSHLLL